MNDEQPKGSEGRSNAVSAWHGWTAVLRAHVGGRWSQAFNTLAGRITAFILAAVMTSLVTTWASVQSIQMYLQDKINTKFPAILEITATRIDDWYDQRRSDVVTFAQSRSVVTNVRQLHTGPSSKRAKEELTTYLTYVLDSFPQYRSLFILNDRGKAEFWVGDQVPISDAVRQGISTVQSEAVSDIHFIGDRYVQVISSRITDSKGKSLGSLHALFNVSVLGSLLNSERLGVSGELFIVAAEGAYLTATKSRVEGEKYGLELPSPGSSPGVHEYTNYIGEHVVGSARGVDRFDWTLVVEESYEEAFRPVVSLIWKVLAINVTIVLLFSIVAFRMSQSITRPIKELVGGALRISEGETEVMVVQKTSHEEIALLTRTFNRMAARLHRNTQQLSDSRKTVEQANTRLRSQNEELQRANEMLEQLSVTDGLTQLYNHRFFQEHLTREIGRVERTKDPLCLILIDIDNFKHLNDRFGHSAGDSVLRGVAEVLGRLVRENDVLARYGGEEFALVPSGATIEDTSMLAEKMRMSISSTEFSVDSDGDLVTAEVTVSVGVAQYQGDRPEFFNSADRALYRAKENGKDCVCVEEPKAAPVKPKRRKG